MKTRFSTCVIAMVMLAACGKDDAPVSTAVDPSVFDAFFAATPPAGAAEIHEVRASATPGEEITLHGRVMGRMRPFVDGRAAFVLGDTTLLTPCNEKPDDSCPTPWDVCCDSAEAKRKGTATVQIIGDDGRVIAQPLREVYGMVELSTLTVRGTVADGSSEDALIVNATAIHVHP